jgi:hypothetical protein
MGKIKITLRKRQQGYFAVILLSVLISGAAWYMVSGLRTAAMAAKGRSDTRTGLALKAAKEAVLAYVATTAASTAELYPGRLPCPENLARGGTTAEGQAAELTDTTCDAVGRLPWKTLGIDQIRDGSGEPLWYAVPTGTWAYSAVGSALTINPGLANQLTYDGTASSVVAVIIAPGTPLNTTGAGTPPTGCTTVNQQVATRNSSLAVANFLECGNGTGSYVSVGSTNFDTTRNVLVEWSNDRTISITAAEVMSAIAGSIADRMQRQVAPTLTNWDALELVANGKSWNNTWGISFLPFASQFNVAPSSNDLCGDAGGTLYREGMLPVASKTSAACATDWTNPNISIVGGSLTGASCTSDATKLVCTFNRIFGVLGDVTVTATAPHIATSFRGTISSGDVLVTAGGTKSVTMSVASNPDQATISVRSTWSLVSNLLLWLFTQQTVTITIPHVADASVLSNSNVTWFVNNGWHRYTYYQVAPGSTLGASPTCPTNTTTCLTVTNLPTNNGAANDKRLVLTYWGPMAVGTENQTGGGISDPAQYLESHTISPANTSYTMQTVTSTYNDRIATCPYKQTWADATTTTICN